MITLILAKILGLYFLTIGIAFLIDPARFNNLYKQTFKDNNFLLLGEILALLIGAVIISIHNRWVLDWSLIITILGWWSFIKGFILLVYPGSIHFFSFIQNKSNNFYRIMALIYLALGAFLIYKGWAI